MDFWPESSSALAQAIGNAVIVYIAIILLVRISGLRSFAKTSAPDFVSTLAIGSILGGVAASGSTPIAVALVAVCAIFFLQWTVSYVRKRVKPFADMVGNNPILLVWKGEILDPQLMKSRITRDELRGKLREANAFSLKAVHAVILETTGDFSVLHGQEDLEIDAFMLDGVDCGSKARIQN